MFRVLRPVDVIGIGIITMGASTGVSAWLGLTDAPAIIAITMGLACPAARRLIAWRRGAAPMRFGGDLRSTALIVFAMLPWLVLPVLRTVPSHAIAAIPTLHLPLPLIVRWAGVALTVMGVLRPVVHTVRGSGAVRSTAYIETIGLFLATGSGFLGLFATAWLMLNVTAHRSHGAAALGAEAGMALA